MEGRLYDWNYDYSKTMWLKMYMAEPDFPNNRSLVYITYERALDIFRVIDNLTQGIRKIVYLVGWQGLGHDDCYPDMDELNEALKRDCDATARESLFWLYNEAKKYNTVVSFHVNLADAYGASKSCPELIAADGVAKNPDGTPAVIEVFNGRDAYKVSYKGYWESGLFGKLWQRFCEATPVREAGTVHIDNFCVAQSFCPETHLEDEVNARNQILDYISDVTGIDVTTEYTYRELEYRADSPTHPIRKFYAKWVDGDLPFSDFTKAPVHTLGRIPSSWWTSGMTAEDCMRIPPSLYSGRLTEKPLLAAFYGCMHGEDIWMRKDVSDPETWAPEFLRQFCTMQLPYLYLNRYDRETLDRDGENYTVGFSGGVVSRGRDGVITRDGVVLKNGGDVCLPLDEDEKTWIVFSENGRNGDWNMPGVKATGAAVYRITSQGNEFLKNAQISDERIALDVEPGTGYAVLIP